jgi:hypothetical protein
MKKRILIACSIIILIVISLGYFLFRPAVNYLSQYLSKSEYVKANVLIVEGWVPLSVLYEAASEFKSNDYQYIVTTGIKNNTDYYELSPKGYLIFKAEKRFEHMVGDSLHLIEIDAFSKPGLDSRAYLRVYLNSEQIADVRPEKDKKMHGVLWKGDISKFDTVKLYFKNDNMSEFGNQSLYLKQIRIDSEVTIPYLGNSVFEIIRPDGNLKIKNNFTSNSGLARNTLIAMGIDSAKVIATAGKETDINRTLTSAIAFREWSDSSGIKIEGINLITMGNHARRTWMTFNKVLNEKYRIGIIPVSEDSSVSSTRLSRMVKTIRETIGIMYYWIILTRY